LFQNVPTESFHMMGPEGTPAINLWGARCRAVSLL